MAEEKKTQHSESQRTVIKAVSLASVGVVAAGLLFAGCSSSAVPADDEFAGSSSESSSSANSSSSSSDSSASSTSNPTGSNEDGSQPTGTDTGDYADGNYGAKAIYGPINEDSINVSVSVQNETVKAVKVTPHYATAISKKYQTKFIKAIESAVVGQPLKGLNVTQVGGASWTSDAFNKALDVIRENASE